jgi:hypothetical protein
MAILGTQGEAVETILEAYSRRMITSDSEDEDKDMNDKDGKVQEELGVTPTTKASVAWTQR